MSSLIQGASVVSSEKIDKNYIIIFDEGHLQFFDYDLFNTALSSLNSSFDTDTTDVTVNVLINNDKFNESNLQGADLLIVTNPGMKSDGKHNVQSDEKGFIESFINDGNGVLYLSNPYSTNKSIAGHGEPMNNLIADTIGASIRLGLLSLDSDNTTIVINDFKNDGNDSHVYFDRNQIEPQTLVDEINTVNKLLYYGSSVSEVIPNKVFGNTTRSTYSISADYSIKQEELREVKWMSGKEIGENQGRGIVIGSSIMFSDYPYDATNAWVDMVDNLAFFQNMVAWLLKITPLDVPVNTVEKDFGFFLRQNILYSFLLPLGLILVTFGYLIYSKTLTLDKLFKVKLAKERAPKSTSKQKKQVSSTSSKTKKKSKKRRKRT